MQDRTLIAIALTCSGSGLLGLMLVMLAMPPELQQPSESSDSVPIRVRGELRDVRVGNGVVHLSLEHDAVLRAVVFSDAEVPVHPGECLELSGEMSTYRGSRELIVTTIKKCE